MVRLACSRSAFAGSHRRAHHEPLRRDRAQRRYPGAGDRTELACCVRFLSDNDLEAALAESEADDIGEKEFRGPPGQLPRQPRPRDDFGTVLAVSD